MAQQTVIFHSNAISASTLSGGSWDSVLSLEMLRDPRPRLRARTTDTGILSTQFRIALARPMTLQGLPLISTNLSNAGRYRVSWYPDATFTTPTGTTGWVAVGESVDWSDPDTWLPWEHPDFWTGAPAFIDPDNQGRDIRISFAEPVVAQYLLVEIDDATNPDGFIDIGHVFAGIALTPTFNSEYDSTQFGRKPNTTIVANAAGARFSTRRGSAKRMMMTWPYLPRDEVLGEIDDMILIHDLDRPVYIDLDPSNTTQVGEKTAFLATIERLPDYPIKNVYVPEAAEGEPALGLALEFLQVL